jgi:predicted signal transduction protein with EAL and GGDEF domain
MAILAIARHQQCAGHCAKPQTSIERAKSAGVAPQHFIYKRRQDGSFMRNLSRDSVNQTMVTAMIKLARTLNFKIIAEQVEDSAALEAARKMGVDYVQGFVIARPARLATAA